MLLSPLHRELRRPEDRAFLVHTLALVAKGLLTELPGMQSTFTTVGTGGSTQSPSYCYGVWMKHLALLRKHGMRTLPRTVLEYGPGNSLGTGFAALLSGAEQYIAIDTVRHADPRLQLTILHELTKLFLARAPRPSKGWPDFDDCLDAGLFPAQALTHEHLANALAPERLRALERAVQDLSSVARGSVRYATWDDPAPVGEGEVDLIFSHAVRCLVKDLDSLYRHAARCLAPGGWMSHQVDFTSMGTTPEWNGHLRYSERIWRRMAGRRPLFTSQDRYSRHVELLRAHGFKTIAVIRHIRYDGVSRHLLATHWQTGSDDDLRCWGAFIIARKPGAPAG
jgi:SAM-dependent methyltransferase